MPANFEHELEIFRTEVAAATQFLFLFLTVHAVAGDKKRVHQLLNRTPLFWNTNLGALQTAAFIVLGRIFDQKSSHNLDRLLQIAQNSMSLFSKEALGTRKRGTGSKSPEWLPEYLAKAYVPQPTDFRRLRGYVRKHRKVYEDKYRDLRHKFFAHKEVSTPGDVDALFAKANIQELQRMLVFLGSLYEALWQLYFNGIKPTLRARRFSIERIRKNPRPKWQSSGVQERITLETENFLLTAAGID